jgi:hypothetical protein
LDPLPNIRPAVNDLSSHGTTGAVSQDLVVKARRDGDDIDKRFCTVFQGSDEGCEILLALEKVS